MPAALTWCDCLLQSMLCLLNNDNKSKTTTRQKSKYIIVSLPEVSTILANKWHVNTRRQHFDICYLLVELCRYVHAEVTEVFYRGVAVSDSLVVPEV